MEGRIVCVCELPTDVPTFAMCGVDHLRSDAVGKYDSGDVRCLGGHDALNSPLWRPVAQQLVPAEAPRKISRQRCGVIC
jgi:hypothetical protein